MRWRNTMLLALLVGVVAGIAYRDVVGEDPNADWSAVFEEPEPTLVTDDIERLVDFDPRSIVAIQLQHRGAQGRSQRTADGWSGTSTPGVIDDFIASLADLAIILSIDTETSLDDLEGYGLRSPRVQVSLERDGQPTISIALGHHNPSATGIYARASGRPGIALTGAVAMWDLEKAMQALAPETDPEG